MAAIELEQLAKVYPDGTHAVQALDLDVQDGEFVVFVGPSGCGKTTALRMVAGLEDITAGSVRIGDRVVNKLPPKDRDVAMVFQNYALYPHMTAFENMAFGLKMRSVPRAEIRRRVREAEIDREDERRPDEQDDEDHRRGDERGGEDAPTLEDVGAAPDQPTLG